MDTHFLIHTPVSELFLALMLKIMLIISWLHYKYLSLFSQVSVALTTCQINFSSFPSFPFFLSVFFLNRTSLQKTTTSQKADNKWLWVMECLSRYTYNLIPVPKVHQTSQKREWEDYTSQRSRKSAVRMYLLEITGNYTLNNTDTETRPRQHQ